MPEASCTCQSQTIYRDMHEKHETDKDCIQFLGRMVDGIIMDITNLREDVNYMRNMPTKY